MATLPSEKRHHFRLMDLPPEIRNTIYEMVLDEVVICEYYVDIKRRNTRLKSTQKTSALLKTSVQIRKETLGIFYGLNMFDIDVDYVWGALKWLRDIGEDAVPHLRHVTFWLGSVRHSKAQGLKSDDRYCKACWGTLSLDLTQKMPVAAYSVHTRSKRFKCPDCYFDTVLAFTKEETSAIAGVMFRRDGKMNVTLEKMLRFVTVVSDESRRSATKKEAREAIRLLKSRSLPHV